MLSWSLLILASYLLGAIPFGFIIGKLTGVRDVRQYGSGKTGATNVYRAAGLGAGLMVFAADLAKGAGIVLVARALFHNPLAMAVAGLVAIIGHSFPVYLRFRGGRGVMTYFGALLALYWPVALVTGVMALGAVALFRYASLGSILGLASSALAMLALGVWRGLSLEFVAYALLGSALVIFLHRDNIVRLLRRTERKLGGNSRR